MKRSAKNYGTNQEFNAVIQSQTGTPTQEMENLTMNDLMIKMYITLKSVMAREEGQDLVEYALVVALIAFGAVAGMSFLSAQINIAFSNIAATLSSNVT
jgi:pilus assembly protein Flp/PilA